MCQKAEQCFYLSLSNYVSKFNMIAATKSSQSLVLPMSKPQQPYSLVPMSKPQHYKRVPMSELSSVVAAIAPWFRLRLPSCGPGFESQAHHLCFFSICIEIVMRKE